MKDNGLAESARRWREMVAEERAAGFPPHACIGHEYPSGDCPCPEAHRGYGRSSVRVHAHNVWAYAQSVVEALDTDPAGEPEAGELREAMESVMRLTERWKQER